MAIGKEFEFLIQWHLTERCNLWCSHWYQERERREELSIDAVRSGLEEIGDMVSAWSTSHGLGIIPSFNVTNIRI